MYILAILYVCVSIFFKNNKLKTILSTIILLIFACGCYQIADYNLYANKFAWYQTDQQAKEPIFQLLMIIFNKLNLTYIQFRIFIFFFAFITMAIVSYKLKGNSGFVYLLYFIFLFCMDCVQIRFSLAMAFAYIGFYFYLKER